MNGLKDFARVSQTVGGDPAITQGGGGNTSVKLDDEIMAVKASGFRLSQMTEEEGYVLVRYNKIREYFNALNLDRDVDIEKEGSDFIKQQVIQEKNPRGLRPSVEAGFHSILGRVVIHTHSVYANLVCCAAAGKALMEKIFDGTGIHAIWVPYTHPGILLTESIRSIADAYRSENGHGINAVFMENHGLIVTTDDAESCLLLHKEINDRIKEYLRLSEDFPALSLRKADENHYISGCRLLTEFFRGNTAGRDVFSLNIYPDHIVYLGSDISFNGKGAKVDINTETGEVSYHTGAADAKAADETLAAYIYVISTLNSLGLEIKTMAPRYVDLIKNWESEAYRKQLMKEFKA